MTSLKEWSRSAGKRYAALKSEAEAAVTRWEWGSSAIHSLEPFYFERHRFGRGRSISAPAKPKSGQEQYGFDADGQLRVTRSYTELEGRCYETFYDHRGAEVDKVHYDYAAKKSVIHVARYRFDAAARLLELEHLYPAAQGRRHERFEWEDARLARVIVDHDGTAQTDDFVYDPAGELLRIERVYPSGDRSVTYERVAPSLPSLLAQLEALALDTIPQLLERLPRAESVCALALWLDMEAYEHVLPPGLALLTVAERQRLVDLHGPDARSYLWNPAEWSAFDTPSLEYRSDELLALAAGANQLIWQKERFTQARKHVDALAKKLMRGDWAKSLGVTDDWVVFPVDISSGDGLEGVRRVAPAKKLALLARCGFI